MPVNQAKKYFTHIKHKYKGQNILIQMVQWRDNKWVGFKRN